MPGDRITPGRAVRCVRCQTEWAPLAAVAEVEPEPDEEIAPEPDAPRAAGRPHRFRQAVATPAISDEGNAADAAESPPVPGLRSAALPLAWAGSILVLAALAACFLVFRHAIAEAWPASQRLYAILGAG